MENILEPSFQLPILHLIQIDRSDLAKIQFATEPLRHLLQIIHFVACQLISSPISVLYRQCLLDINWINCSQRKKKIKEKY